jgi:hypothetical protein
VVLLVVAVAATVTALYHNTLLGGRRGVRGGLVGVEESFSPRKTEVPWGMVVAVRRSGRRRGMEVAPWRIRMG